MALLRLDRAAFRRGGFTLVELIAVLVIVGVLAGLALPRAAQSASYHDASGAAREAAAVLNRERAEAVALGEAREIMFDADAGSYRVTLEASGSVVRRGAFSADMRLARFTSGDDGSTASGFVFDAWGRPRFTGTGRLALTSARSSGRVRFTAGAHRASAVLDDITGLTRVEIAR
ncbi:MAG: type II secretion system protein [Planctomycetota bacterium]